jgi:hypothetical protein
MVKVLATRRPLRQKLAGMKQLILFRHAKAVPADEADDDFDRPLADRGR